MSNKAGVLAALVAAAGVMGVAADARAGGLYVSERGVRPLGRGGAFVAGADDAGAIAYNPAGIFDAGDSFLIDGSLVIFGSQFTRQALLRQIDPNTGEVVSTYEQTFPTAEGTATLLPIPTIAATVGVHKNWRLGFGAYAPSAVLPAYPEEVEGAPSASRYQLVNLDGSALIVAGGYVAWRPIEQLRFGVGVDLLLGSFNSTVYLSGCVPERFFCAPEDPEWDIKTQIKAVPIVSPSGTLGATWEFYKGWRLGASFHLPYWVIAPATVKTRLPTAAPYKAAAIEGEDATVTFQLPWEVRLGIETRDLVKGLRIEVAGHYEHWAIHDSIEVKPDGVAVTNVPGFPREYYLPDISIPRKFQGSVAAMIGAEYAIRATEKVSVTPRLGFSYETSAVPSEYISLLTLDAGKATPSVGLSVSYGAARFDAGYAHKIYLPVDLAPDAARLEQVTPLSANPAEHPDYVNGGVYRWHIDIVGIGFSYMFDKPKPIDAVDEKKAPEPKPPAKKPAEEKKEGALAPPAVATLAIDGERGVDL